MARKPSAITEQQKAFVEAKMRGLNDLDAKKEAGIPIGTNAKEIAAIKDQLAAARRWLTNTSQITRLDVLEGIIDGIELARMQGDSGNVIKGWTEVAKILGHYAPEIKKIELSMSQGRILNKLEGMSDEELLRIQEGTTFDGECTTIN